jgi:hypothetical protein
METEGILIRECNEQQHSESLNSKFPPKRGQKNVPNEGFEEENQEDLTQIIERKSFLEDDELRRMASSANGVHMTSALEFTNETRKGKQSNKIKRSIASQTAF